MRPNYSEWFIKFLIVGLAAVLVIAPFYLTLAIWIASDIHHLDLFKIWKELVLVIMSLVIIVFLTIQQDLAKRILRSRLVKLIIVYIILILLIGMYDLLTHRVSRSAVIYGLLIDIRPAGFFMVAYMTFLLSSKKNIPPINWKKLVLIPALLVMIFGFLQMTVLPKDILKHVGYSDTTTPPYQTVDNQPDLVRIQSTTRGPNPLGAYDLLIITAISVLLISAKRRDKLWLGIFFAICIVVLFGTYSRSAEVGLVLSWLALFTIYQKKWLNKHNVGLLIIIGIILLLGAAAVHRQNYLLQNVFFHSSNSSKSATSSNAQRSQALKTAASDVIHHPLGGGIGSAGPASRRNSMGPVKISENTYLQIGQEAGIAGMLLFVAIIIGVGWELWQRRQNQLALILLASLVGLSFVNLVSHAWTDDTLAYIWWGLAGIACASVIITDKHKQKNGKKITKT